ncbi:MAG: DUF2802 domain-containing protein [Proteobacteria bacterium]|nr:DUF2802 domain-containing protein [Pseudomonadota bacterium]
MTFWTLIQIFLFFAQTTALCFLWIKLNRPQKDDPRLSKGLQLLQSKISVLEDLSDRIEIQVEQLNQLMEAKIKDVQSHLLLADKHVQKIEASMSKSMEVAKIFQDRIPHQEIIERQNTIKYVKAARMAHAGVSIEEICQTVDLTRGEVEMIAKVNREQLQFAEDSLPAWVNDTPAEAAPQFIPPIVKAEPRAEKLQDKLSELGQKFRQAMVNPAPAAATTNPQLVTTTVPTKDLGVRKVVFPRIEVNKAPTGLL